MHPSVLEDGSTILVIGALVSDRMPDRIEGTLSGASDVSAWIAAAAAAGVTYDVLKMVASTIAARGWVEEPPHLAMDGPDVVDAVSWYLASVGHADTIIQEVRKVDGQGWVLQGICRDGLISARTDESGRVIHLRVR